MGTFQTEKRLKNVTSETNIARIEIPRTFEKPPVFLYDPYSAGTPSEKAHEGPFSPFRGDPT